MGFLIFAVFIVGVHCAVAGHSQHYTIPIEGYETKLHDLGQHVEYSKAPVKVIKITKTVAVKIPVPYPVKVREKVPYPVHVAKPYPVPVPQIIKVPVASVSQKDSNQGSQEQGWQSSGDQGQGWQNSGDQGQGWQSSGDQGYAGVSPSFYGHQFGQSDDGQKANIGRAYEIQENSYVPNSDGHGLVGIEANGAQSNDDAGSYAQAQNGNTYSFEGEDAGKPSFAHESQSYDDALNDYFKKNGQVTNGYGGQYSSNGESSNNDHSQYH